MALFPFLSRATRYEKAAEKYRSQVAQVGELSDEMHALSDAALKERVRKFAGQPLAAVNKGQIEIFAAVREAGARTLAMKHFDVQLLGGFALLAGNIAEMKTGEGKTLVATLPLILRGITGQGAHLVTVNDYLAKRDAAWMAPLYEFFDLSVGISVPGQTTEEKRAAYAADITYGTNNEFGFDYLRNNMAQRKEDMVQRELSFAIVDEVDSILIDEARTPLIISAPDVESTQLYAQFSRLVPQLKEGADYNIDEKRRAATLTDDGTSRVEKMLDIDNIYEEKGMRFVHHLEQALRAHTLYRQDKDYVVRDGQVIIVDEFTGRLMEGRRYSEGLHQALEAKEGVKVQQESRTLATITFQNLFRLYETLAGMTGTAATSAEEFEKVYNIEVVVVPTNKQLIREDKPDRVFVSESAKFTAVVGEIKRRYEAGQPVLVGTIAIEKSERLSALLKREGVPHEVLNAKHHAREAEIIGKAGQRGAVTISTNMAGRGTDIKLGEGVPEVGGLFVLGTERHEARRIDNQLRGRSGRQGDPGETQLFVSLEDDVMRIFGGEKIRNIMKKLKVPEDEPIENKMVSRALEGAQERVEGYYFDMRKQVLSYDDVLNRQRGAIYTLRRSVLLDQQWSEASAPPIDLRDYVPLLIKDAAEQLVQPHVGESSPETWNSEEMAEGAAAIAGLEVAEMHRVINEAVAAKSADGPEVAKEHVVAAIAQAMIAKLHRREEELSPEIMLRLQQAAAMRAIDIHWMEHLDTMDYLRTGIGLRGYGQRDPLVEYQKEGYQLFQRLLDTIKSSFIETVFRAQPAFADASASRPSQDAQLSGGQEGSALHQLARRGPESPGTSLTPGGSSSTPDVSAAPAGKATASSGEQIKNPNKDVGRNDPCPCGSGKKFKKCHGAV